MSPYPLRCHLHPLSHRRRRLTLTMQVRKTAFTTPPDAKVRLTRGVRLFTLTGETDVSQAGGVGAHLDPETTESILESSLPSRFDRPFPWDQPKARGTRDVGNVSAVEGDSGEGSVDINSSGSFEDYIWKEDLASEVSDRITTLKRLDTEANQKRLVKKRTRDELAYLHAGLGHMIDIYREFVDPGLPRKQGQF